MNPSKAYTHAFIVRVWIEPREIIGAESKWRGVIEKAKGGERMYFDDLDEVRTYFDKYLREMGIQLDNR